MDVETREFVSRASRGLASCFDEAGMLPNLFGRVTTVLGEHAELQTLLRKLREVANEPIDRRSDVDLPALAQDFRQKLLEHFQAEEADGYFGTLLAVVPALSPEVARLRDEHVLFRSLAERLAQLSESTRAHQEFSHALWDFLVRFGAHERAENLLLEEFFRKSKDD